MGAIRDFVRGTLKALNQDKVLAQWRAIDADYNMLTYAKCSRLWRMIWPILKLNKNKPVRLGLSLEFNFSVFSRVELEI